MTAIIIPELNRQTLDDLRERLPKVSELDLSRIDTPSLERAGKTADEAIDRVLGRSRTSLWPWLATGIGLVVVVGAVTAWFAFLRRPAWPRMGLGSSTAGDAVRAAENEGMTPHVPLETFREDAFTATMRANGSAIEDS